MFNGMYVGAQPGDKTGWEDEKDCISSDLKTKWVWLLLDKKENFKKNNFQTVPPTNGETGEWGVRLNECDKFEFCGICAFEGVGIV